MTITLGYWFFPLFVTVASFGVAFAAAGNGRGIDMTPVPALRAAVIVSLLTWLIYFAARASLS